ncbi:uncharacterized protein LOC134693569 [Mytilus trossulus]|uniref:uncharacterized protein LOC134693569 n=1 Tax=Mytilus trossulus TaxID=6551 RepID=UPI003003E70D
MHHIPSTILITCVILGFVNCDSSLRPLRSGFFRKIIPLTFDFPVCEPNSICKWAVCEWNRDPDLILSNSNCYFYNNHQCNRCPENYECQNTNDKEVEASFVTYAYRCLPL